MGEDDLQKRLERLGRTLVADIEAWEQSTRDRRRDVLQLVTEHVAGQLEKAFEKEKQKREARRQLAHQTKQSRREAKRARKRDEASGIRGVAMVVAALALAAFAVLRPDLWWLVFVALGVGLGGAQQFALVGERRRLARGAAAGEAESVIPDKAPAREKPHEVDELCDHLLRDLKASPEAVRAFLEDPERTVQSLRTTAHALDDRRHQLLADVSDGHVELVQRQRAELLKKRDASSDGEVRRRLDAAVASVDGQLAAMGQLRAAAERVDVEYTSLLASLQELRARVAVAKTAGDGAPHLEGLERSVARLNDELGAITEALDAVQREGVSPVSAISSEGADAAPRRERERA